MNTLRALPGTGSPLRIMSAGCPPGMWCSTPRWGHTGSRDGTRWAALTLAPTTYWAAPDGRQFETGTAATLSL